VNKYITHVGDIFFEGDEIYGVGEVYSFYKVKLGRIQCFFVNKGLSCFEETVIIRVVGSAVYIYLFECSYRIVHMKTIEVSNLEVTLMR